MRRNITILVLLFVVAIAIARANRIAAQNPSAYAWRNAVIKGGGFVSGIVFHPAERDLVYARTDVGGAYRWEVSQKQWLPLTDWIGRDDSNYMGIESLAVDPNDPKRLYLAAGTYTQSWAGNGAFLISTDQGRTWSISRVPFKMGGNEDGRSNGERLAVDPELGSTLFFGSRKDGLWKSTDSGANWRQVASFPVTNTPNGVGITFVEFVGNGSVAGSAVGHTNILVGVSRIGTNLYRSTDRGATWEAVPGQPTDLMPHHIAYTPLGATPDPGPGGLDAVGSVYITYGNGPGPNNVTDGSVWKHDLVAGSWRNVAPRVPSASDRFGYSGVTVDRTNPRIVMVSTIDRWNVGDEIFRSSDSGITWSGLRTKTTISSNARWTYFHSQSSGTAHWMGDLEIDPFNSDRALYVTGWGIYGSEDLTSADKGDSVDWMFHNDGLEETVPLDLVSPPSGAQLLSALGDIGGFRHNDLTSSPSDDEFYNPIGSTNTSIDFAENNPNVVVRVHSGASRGSYSTDGGATWQNFSSVLDGAAQNGPGAIAVSADGITFVWMPRGGSLAYTSTDRSATWIKGKKGPFGDSNARQIFPTSDRVNPDLIYIYDPNTGNLHVRKNGGFKFPVRSSGLPIGGGIMRAVPGFEGHLWLPGGSSGMLRSTDAGVSFGRLNSVQEAYQVGFGKAAPGQIYSAVYLWGRVNNVTGIFRSDDVGASWVRINDEQHQYGWVNAIIGDPRVYGRVYLATGGRGIVYGDPQ